jgi:type II secretory pathway predicted ATPase ExeA
MLEKKHCCEVPVPLFQHAAKSASPDQSAMKADPMYEAYFQLRKRPFSAIPDPTCFFAPGPVQELYDELILRAESGQGIGILTAEAGTGKTLVCRRMAAELGGRFTPVFLANANVPTRRALLQSILFELKKRFSGLDEQELRLAVYAALRELTLSGRGTVLIVDEAHLLNERLLEELRMLASLAERDEPLVRLILAGQPPLEERLAQPALEALNQRIVCQVYLEPLTRQQSIEYVNFRVRWAGGDTGRIFTPAALERIASACNGLPRCLNQLCDHVLLLTHVQEQPRVTGDAVCEALEDLKQLPLHWNTPLAADVPFNSDDDDLSAPEAAGEVGDAGFSPVIVEDVARGPAQRATACIEVGGLLPEVGPAIAATSVAPSGRPGQRSFVEETIDDLYAVLDVRLPRVRRTFEDCAVPENWHLRGQTAGTDMPLPLVPPAGTPNDADRSAEMTDDRRQAPPGPGDETPGAGDPTAEVSDYASFENLDVGSRLTYDAVECERQPLEEQLGSSMLDACLEVQSAIGQWHVADGTIDSIEQGDSSVADADEPVVPPPDNQYDVVEPDREEAVTEPDAAAPNADETDSDSGARYVPQPKYRHVFSTLRRRLGGGPIHKE